MKQDLVIVETSRDPIDAICSRLPEVSQKHKFGVLGTHDLREKMRSKGVDFDRECRVFEICNPHKASEVLRQSMEVSTALPCRISVWEEGGLTKLATIRPTALLTLFALAGAEDTAREVEETVVQIMKETASGRA